ncbi:hypothetical protein E2C01_085588 [Portunus trituberculatus]|uniref:Uncharacterized protein n=1 Tax=Portunus trituberculatus TaxID=210409 RepID=A0A5B7J801_PORTR|nr:hypothetical protein [Portunus trituberculatus]
MEEDDAMDGLAGAARHVNKRLGARLRGARSEIIETPLGLRQLGDWSKEREFSDFKEDRVNMRRIIIMDKELKALKVMVGVILERQDQLIRKNLELRERCLNLENTVKMNQRILN